MNKCVESVYDKSGSGKDSNGILNTDVSFDGTWMTKGHTSKVGVAFVMDISTGLALDFEVLKKFCRACANMKKKDKKSFEDWIRMIHAGKCNKNFQGTSGAMEATAAV